MSAKLESVLWDYSMRLNINNILCPSFNPFFLIRKSGLVFLSFIILLLASSCDKSRIYEKNIDFKDNDWYVDSVATFSFQINQVSTEYNVLTNVRNAISYPFANLYIKYYLFGPDGKVIESKLLRLPLFDKKSGKPYGDGLGDIFDHQFALLKNHQFKEPGNYKIQIKQYMRQDPLPFVMSLGVRVEIAPEEKQQ